MPLMVISREIFAKRPYIHVTLVKVKFFTNVAQFVKISPPTATVAIYLPIPTRF